MLVPVLASIGSVYDRAIVDTGRQAEFLFFVSFLVTFGFIRTSAHMIKAQVSWWPGNVQVGGTHIHHLVWGICLLLIIGYVGVAVAPPSPWHEIVTVLFGVGTGPDPRRVRPLARTSRTSTGRSRGGARSTR